MPLKNDQFKWSKTITGAFDKLKLAISLIPVLTIDVYSKPFVNETDSSGVGIGVGFLQDE